MRFETVVKELRAARRRAPKRVSRALAQRPLLEPESLRGEIPLKVPARDIIRYCHTSGSTGEPKRIPYTRRDLDHAVKAQVRAYLMGGVRKHDRHLCVMNYGPWSSGLICQAAGEVIGLTIPAEARLGIAWQLSAIQHFRPSYLTCLPSFLTILERGARERGLEPGKLGINRVFVVGEALGAGDRRHFEAVFKAKIRDMYANTEFGVIASECEAGSLHVFDDLFQVEILREGKPCPPGEVGELVVTARKREALSLVRYNTHDLASLPTGSCACGSKFPRLSAIQGRSDDMLVLAGGKFYPSHFERAVARLPSLSSRFQVTVQKQGGLDQLSFQIETRTKQPARVKSRLASSFLQSLLKVDPQMPTLVVESKTLRVSPVRILDPGALPLLPGKQKKIRDERFTTASTRR